MLRNSIKEDLKENFISEEEYWQYNKEYSDKIKKIKEDIQLYEEEKEKETIKKAISTFYNRFFTQQFKRNCMPDGVKVGSICFSPRGDWRMPSDASRNLWTKQVEEI